MPEPTTPPADGTQGGGQPAEGQPQGQPQGGQPEQTFTQADVDRILKERLARAVPSDYEELKKKAEAHDAAEEAQKTELQKAQDAAKAAADREKAAVERANATLKRAAILAEAATQKAVDPTMVADLLAGKAEIAVDKDGTVTGVAEAVKQMLKDKPFLLAKSEDPTPGASGGEFGGDDGKTVAQRIKELEKKGDRESLAEARDLKIRAAMGGQK